MIDGFLSSSNAPGTGAKIQDRAVAQSVRPELAPLLLLTFGTVLLKAVHRRRQPRAAPAAVARPAGR